MKMADVFFSSIPFCLFLLSLTMWFEQPRVQLSLSCYRISFSSGKRAGAVFPVSTTCFFPLAQCVFPHTSQALCVSVFALSECVRREMLHPLPLWCSCHRGKNELVPSFHLPCRPKKYHHSLSLPSLSNALCSSWQCVLLHASPSPPRTHPCTKPQFPSKSLAKPTEWWKGGLKRARQDRRARERGWGLLCGNNTSAPVLWHG